MDKDDYEIGYGKPPKYTQFKPGRSGNAKGRPKGAKNLKTDLKEKLQEKIAIKESGAPKTVSKQRAMIKAQMVEAVHEGVVTMRQLSGKESLAEGHAGIPSLPRKALVIRWAKAYGRPPPKGISRRLLEYAAAYDLQSKELGGLKPAAKRKLSQTMNFPANDRSATSRSGQRNKLSTGSRLIREWHGRTYTVDVQESGFIYDGEQYASLSQVARAITGARWSGPRFFGL